MALEPGAQRLQDQQLVVDVAAQDADRADRPLLRA
jgi:hypothetical protein